MAGIWIAALITTLISLGLIGFLIAKISPADDRRFLVLVAVLNLPMWIAAFYLVRLPMDSALKAVIGAGATTTAFLFVTTILYAPVTEESAKLTLMLFPWFRRRIDGTSAIAFGLAIGVGFGVGEMWQAAYWISEDPEVASTPWYLLSGFMIERLLVCFNHAAFTTAALRTIWQAPVRSVSFAVGLHWMGNFPLFLRGINFGGLGAESWQTVVSIWVPAFSIGMIVLLAYFYAESRQMSLRAVIDQFIGQAQCPECGTIYQRPLLGVNSGPLHRYERCPGCKKWHRTKKLKEGDLDSTNDDK